MPDELVGIRPRAKRDFFAGCNEPGSSAYIADPDAFMKVWCARCRRSECVRAKGYVAAWESRMEEQVDYLINAPRFSRVESNEHKALAGMMFTSLEAKARRLEVAAKRQDWVVPSEAEAETAEDVASVREPAKDNAESSVVYQTDYPSIDGRRTYHVELRTSGHWSCECAGFQHRKRCKHITAVRTWYEEQGTDVMPVGVNTTAPLMNLERAVRAEAEPSPGTTEHDPWSPRSDRVVPVGGTVVLGSVADDPPDP